MLDYYDMYSQHLGQGKRASINEYVFPCWRCTDRRGKRAMKLYVNMSTGLYCCHKCRHLPDGLGQGSAKKFAKLMKLDLSEYLTINNTSKKIQKEEPSSIYDSVVASKVYSYMINELSLSSDVRNYVEASRGIEYADRYPYSLRSSEHAVFILKSKFSTDELCVSGLSYYKEDKLRMHRSITPGKIIIPYYKDNKIIYFRSRGTDRQGKTMYIGPLLAKSKYMIWGIPKKEDRDIIVTEGEFKAMAAQNAGVNCVALPGMGSAHEAFAELCKSNNIKNVVVCFDTQVHSMLDVDGAANSLINTLKRQTNYPINIYRAYLPLCKDISDGSKVDIDSYIVSYGSNSFRKVIDNAERC